MTPPRPPGTRPLLPDPNWISAWTTGDCPHQRKWVFAEAPWGWPSVEQMTCAGRLMPMKRERVDFGDTGNHPTRPGDVVSWFQARPLWSRPWAHSSGGIKKRLEDISIVIGFAGQVPSMARPSPRDRYRSRWLTKEAVRMNSRTPRVFITHGGDENHSLILTRTIMHQRFGDVWLRHQHYRRRQGSDVLCSH